MSFATEQVARIETLLADNPGVKSVVVGNTTVTYEDLLKQYDYWKNLADRETGRRASTLERGTGSAPPIECESVTVRKVSISFKMLNKDGDTTLTALLAAAYGGTPVALRTKDKSAGKGYDGDCNLTVKHGKPIKGEQVFDFSATPNDDQRTPELYV
jgi:hypothetical protein